GAAAVRFDLARPARLDRLGAPARAAELPPGPTLVACRRHTRGRVAAARAPDQRRGLRRALGALELLGGNAVDVHRPVPRLRRDLRDARARLPRLPAVRARVLRDVSLAPRAARRRRRTSVAPAIIPPQRA